MNIKQFFYVSLILLLPVLSADVNVLIVGSSSMDDFWLEEDQEPAFRFDQVAEHLEKILEGTDRGKVTVVTEERYRRAETAPGFTVQAKNLYSWYHWSYPEGSKSARWANLRGEAETEWDYVILIGDPDTIKGIPGVFAQGVASIEEEVAEGGGKTLLLMPWPENASLEDIAHFREVVYRVGGSGEIPVAPAALAWVEAGKPVGEVHPSSEAAYLTAATLYSRMFGVNAKESSYTVDDDLADTACKVVMSEWGGPEFQEDFAFMNPFSILGDKRRHLAISHKGTSTESRLQKRLPWTFGSLNLTFDSESYNKTYTSFTPEDDEKGWPVDKEMPIAFNHGRHPDFVRDGHKGYVTHPEFWQLGFAFLFQWKAFEGFTVTQSNEHYAARMDMELYMTHQLLGPENLAEGRGPTARAIPLRALWAEIYKEYPDQRFQTDRAGHLNYGLNKAAATFMYTLYSGRTPVEDVSTEPFFVERGLQDYDLFCQRVGYEMAWRMGRVQTRVPGFRVKPGSTDASVSRETFEVRFLYPPKENVKVKVRVSDRGLADVLTRMLVFTPQNYQQPRYVTIKSTRKRSKAIRPYSVEFFTTSHDEVFDGLTDSWRVQDRADEDAAP